MKKVLRALLSVAAASFGVRSKHKHRQDLENLPVLVLILAALLFTAAFVAVLMGVVSWVV